MCTRTSHATACSTSWCFAPRTPSGSYPALFAAILDRSGDFPNRAGAFEVFRGSEVTVVSDPPLGVQFDGEAIGLQTPFKARLLPEAARYVVSEECIKTYA